MKKIILILLVLGICSPIFGQQSLLQSGPMVGYSEMMEVLLWVQTKETASVKFAYWEKNNKKSTLQYTETATTEAHTAFTTKLIAKTEQGKQYDYQLFINDKPCKFDYPTSFQSQKLWQWRENPPNFKMALGSCTYINEPEVDRPGKPYGGEYEIFTVIANSSPDMMLWLGDNIYLREVDWYTRTGILHRNTHARSTPEMQPLLANTHNYAIWDDHDFGPNDADGSFIHKDKTLEAFQLFWGNPTFGLPHLKGTMSQFLFNDIEFFLLDNRYYKSPNRRKTGKRQVLGEEQIEWLIDALSTSYAPFKMVAIGGQVLNTAPVYENYANYPDELNYLLKRLEEERIKGVIFLTGDRHHTELSKMVTESGYTLYDLTVSPLTSGTGSRAIEEPNRRRVEGTCVMQRNYGTIEFSGPRTKRELKITIFDVKGEELWTYEIKASDFK